MKKIRILASAFAGDVKSGASDAALRKKYGLSAASLLKVKKELLQKGLLSVEDVGPLQPVDASSRTSIRARDFLASFSKRPDDFHLMAEYSLTPDQLERIYETLIEKGLLSEYEFNARSGKTPEIDDRTEPIQGDATSITWKTEEVDSGRVSMEIRKFMLSLAEEDGAYPDTTRQTMKKRPVEADNRDLSAPEHESCPNCGHPKDSSSPESCARCGIVFAKIGKIGRKEKISVWNEGYEMR